MKMSRPISLSVLCAATCLALSGCYVRVNDHKDTQNPDDLGSSPSPSGQTPTQPVANPAMNECRNVECVKVEVWVLYSLNQDLGNGHTVMVEAFDNRHFEGSPVASATITGFDANQPGSHGKAELSLAPGNYYLRAFITNDAGLSAPYEYGGMKLISNKPVGFFGAASGAQSLNVRAGAPQEPVTVTLAYLFQGAESATPSDANMRILFKVAEGKTVEVNRKLKIELRDTTDLAVTPKATYELPSDALLVTGRVGAGEFVARNLTPGKYSVFAFIDSNGNDFADDGELQQVYKVNGAAAFATINGNRTETLQLLLE